MCQRAHGPHIVLLQNNARDRELIRTITALQLIRTHLHSYVALSYKGKASLLPAVSCLELHGVLKHGVLKVSRIRSLVITIWAAVKFLFSVR